MLVIGASGHAVEILDILSGQEAAGTIAFYHPVNAPVSISSIKKYDILTSEKALKDYFITDPRFVLGIGDSVIRHKMADLCRSLGGQLQSVISGRAYISSLNVVLGNGLNIMHDAIIQPEVTIGEGTLINCGAIVHHESFIGKYCQVSPSATLAGKVNIGHHTMIGAGATVLPKVQVGNNVIVAAGAVVTQNVPDNVLVAGVPAVIKKTFQTS